MKIPATSRRKSQGFTMVEVLVSSFIMAVSLLGLAALQGKSMRHNQNAFYTSQAALLAYDMADRIRANRTVKILYATAAAADRGCSSDEGGGGANDCTPGDMVADDLFQWQRRIQESLPGGAGALSAPVGGNCDGGLVVGLSWNQYESDSDAADQTQTFNLCLLYL